MQKKSLKKKKKVDFKELDEKLNVLTFMKNDIDKIVDKENEIYKITKTIQSTKEQESSIATEQMKIILDEFIACCEKKKKKLQNYVNVADDIIRKNEELIEEEKKEIDRLILEKDEEMQLIQQKIDSAKNIHDSLNYAMADVMNNLTDFINYKIKGNINVKELIKIDQLGENNKEGENKKPESEKEQLEKNEKIKDKQSFEEIKTKLYESMDIYKKILQDVKLIRNENANVKNEVSDSVEQRNRNNIPSIPFENKNPSLVNSENTKEEEEEEEEKEEEEEEKKEDDGLGELSCDNNWQKTTLITKNDISDEMLKNAEETANIQNEEKQVTDQHTESGDSDTKKDTEKSYESSNEDEEDEDYENEEDSEYSDLTYGSGEEEADSASDEEGSSEYNSGISDREEEGEEVSDKEKVRSVYSDGTDDSEAQKDISDEHEDEIDRKNASEKAPEKMTNTITVGAIAELLMGEENSQEEENISDRDSLYLEDNEHMLKGRTEMFLQEIKNTNIDYLSYFEEKLKNS